MIDIFRKYLRDLYKDVPLDVYEILLCSLFWGIVLIFVTQGVKRGWKKVFWLLLAEYVVLLFFTTVFSRTHGDVPKFNFSPFWSYMEIINGRENLIPENIMNVMAFVPIGILLGLSYCKQNWKRVLLGAVCISSSIELLQFILHKGFSELDDIMHNTLGCMIGYGIYKTVSYCFRKSPEKTVL